MESGGHLELLELIPAEDHDFPGFVIIEQVTGEFLSKRPRPACHKHYFVIKHAVLPLKATFAREKSRD
jgi:hypothetical protein